jgi:hypothetical protein
MDMYLNHIKHHIVIRHRHIIVFRIIRCGIGVELTTSVALLDELTNAKQAD